MPKPTTGRDFYIATADEIRAGRTSDIYFARTLDVLKKAGRSRAKVVAEVTTGALPNGWPWGIFCGLEEVVHLLTGKDVSVWALPEGSLLDRKSTRLNSSHLVISYAAFCLKKKIQHDPISPCHPSRTRITHHRTLPPDHPNNPPLEAPQPSSHAAPQIHLTTRVTHTSRTCCV